ncbi:MAG: IclR family transcriptional regulator C-terminal domain-containing protein [Spirochaetes bacterium]|nr:IclR family transcriptional regulator C-terminal domain-containing protein [Spirochaetota bacterium]
MAAPHLKALKDEFDEKVYLTVRDCDQVYCVDDMEHEEGVRCIHAPLRNSGGRVIGAISLSGFAQRVSGEGEIAEKVVGAAREISRVLDCNP